MSTRPRILTRGDILGVPQTEVPMLMLSDNLGSWVSRRIKAHTDGYYNHAMWMPRAGKVATQGWIYHTRDIEDYLDGGYRLKFWTNDSWTVIHRSWLLMAIRERLSEPWYRRLYDVLGVAGQLVRLKGINVPYLRYCSESAAEILGAVDPLVKAHPSPADLNRYFKRVTGWRVWGVYDPDLAD